MSEKPYLFTKRNEVPFWYSVYNAKRSGGLHRGVDVRGLDDDAIHCPVAGTVARTTRITSHADPTWEWGYYVRVDDAQGNKHYFCHCAANSFGVRVGAKIAAETVIARMGCTGNAALASPPVPHVHYEVRTAKGNWLNPCNYLSMPNTVGIHQAKSAHTAKNVRINTPVLHVRTGPSTDYGILQNVKFGEVYTIFEEKAGWGYCKMLGGWLALNYSCSA